ncbi:hypothetical protein CVT25_002629, partial [Psilocybe cyanescens]
MAKDNLQSSKESKFSSMFDTFKRRISPAPSEQSKGSSSKSRSLRLKSFFKSPSTTPTQLTSSLPLASSTADSRGETALGEHPIISPFILYSKLNVVSSIATIPSSHHTSAALSDTLQPASFLVVQDEPESSAQQATTTTTSLDQSRGEKTVTYYVNRVLKFHNLPQGLVRNPSEDGQKAPKTASSTKGVLAVTGRSILTLTKRLPEIVDGNPVKMALGLVKLIIEIQQAVANNMDTVKRRLTSTRAQLETVEKELGDWTPKTLQEGQWIEQFKLILKEELDKLIQLSEEWLVRKVADHEDEKMRITEIFERINEARVQFELAIGIRVFKSVYDMGRALRKLLFNGLTPSKIADHKYHLESQEERRVRREVCTPGTRVRILGDIVIWAKNTSRGSPNVYWLFGQAGSGKTTIAYSVARRFEFAGDPNDTIILGGNFFCSRQFEESRLSKCIIRTVVHHLALKCRAFADQLSDFDTVNQNVRAQLEDLLIAPWQASKPSRCHDPSKPTPHYLIIIDALDEINGTGGSEFLRDLLEVIDKSKNRLQGLKFFVTSRPDPNLVRHVDSLKSKQLYRLEEVPPEEAQYDIRTYLTAELPHFAGREEIEDLVVLTAGLFIYAATVVKYLVTRGRSEQQTFLTTLLASSNSFNLQPLSNGMPFTLLDTLYSQILNEAFRDFIPEENGWKNRRSILYTFLCTAERTSTSVVANLLFTSDYTDVAEKLLSDLHAVLYREDGRVLAYHKSFSDFIFAEARSGNFWCDQGKHHRLLAESCFRSMKDGLRFNIANISSSFVLDVDDPRLADAVKENIPLVLSYSSRNWSYHLSAQGKHHRLLAESCFRSMKDGLRFNIANISSSFVLDVDDPRLADAVKENIPLVLSYSSRNWSYHLSAAPSTIPDGLHDSISDFLQLRALFWIEAMNLLGLRGLCSSMLRTAHDWVMSSTQKTSLRLDLLRYISVGAGSFSLAENLTEARSFAIYFSGSNASSSTPHLYISALATWPRNLDPCRGWKSHFPRIPGFTGALLGGTLLMTLYVNSQVNAVAVSPNGKKIVSGSDDNLVRVWDVSTGNELKVLKGHTHVVTSVAFSPDGKKIVSGSHDNSVMVWDVSTGNELKVLKGHTYWVTSVAFSPDGKKIVSGSDDSSVRVWDASTGNELKVIVSGSDDSSVRVWDASTGNELKVVKGHTYPVTSVAFAPNAKQIMGHTFPVTSVAFSPDGKQI